MLKRNLIVGLAAFLTLSFYIQARSIHDENAQAVDRDRLRAEALKNDFISGKHKKYCPDLEQATTLSCFASYLENRSDGKKLSVVEVPVLTEVATAVTLTNRNPSGTSSKSASQDPAEEAFKKLEEGTNFLSLLSGLYVMSGDYRSLVPADKSAQNKKQKVDIENLKSIELDMAKKIRSRLGENLHSLTQDSLAELRKLSDSPQKAALEKRLLDIQKTVQ